MRIQATTTTIALVLLAAPAGRAAVQPAPEVRDALEALGAHATGSLEATFRVATPRPTFVRGFRTEPLGAVPEQAAIRFVGTYAALFGIADPGSELRHLGTTEWRGHHLVRFEQVSDGLPVFDRAAVVWVDPAGSVRAFSSNLAAVEPGPAALPGLDASMAFAAARAHVGWPAHPGPAVLGVWASDATARLAWRISLAGDDPDEGALVTLDAVTGKALMISSSVFTAQGRVFLQNPVHDSDTPTVVEIPRLGSGGTLTGSNAAVWKHVPDGEPVQTALADTSGDFLFDPPSMSEEPVYDDPFAEVNAYYHIDFISHYFQSAHGFTQTRGPIAVFVNYVETAGTPYRNAFFSPEAWSISLGQAADGDFAYDADTMYHEFTHAVVDSVAHLVYQAADPMGMIVFPGAMHEGLADTFAVSLTDDPDMGEYILGRNLVNDRRCPDDILGEVHYDGEIIGGTNWEIREVIGADALETVAYGALSALHPTSSFREYAAAMMEAVETLEDEGDLTAGDVADVRSILEDRGVDVCDRIMSLDEGETYTVSMFGLDAFGGCGMLEALRMADIVFPPAFQWSIDVPGDATSLTIHADVDVEGEDYDVAVHVRAGNYVVYEMVSVPYGGGSLPLRVETADATFTNPEGPIVLTPYTDPAIATGQTYFFTVNYLGCASGTNTVSAEVGFDPVDDPEAEEIEPVPEEEPEPELDATTDAPDHGEITAHGGACGCVIVG
jgi:Zn-dependent metalloprotease